MVFDGKTEDFEYACFDGLRFDVLFAFHDMVCRAGNATFLCLLQLSEQ